MKGTRAETYTSRIFKLMEGSRHLQDSSVYWGCLRQTATLPEARITKRCTWLFDVIDYTVGPLLRFKTKKHMLSPTYQPYHFTVAAIGYTLAAMPNDNWSYAIR